MMLMWSWCTVLKSTCFSKYTRWCWLFSELECSITEINQSQCRVSYNIAPVRGAVNHDRQANQGSSSHWTHSDIAVTQENQPTSNNLPAKSYMTSLQWSASRRSISQPIFQLLLLLEPLFSHRTFTLKFSALLFIKNTLITFTHTWKLLSTTTVLSADPSAASLTWLCTVKRCWKAKKPNQSHKNTALKQKNATQAVQNDTE